MNTIETDVLIIGAGPAGCLAAANLHRDGHRVLVVEKQVFPRFVIGESMLPSSMNLLQEAGLLEAVEQQNFMRKFGAVFLRGDETCNFDFANQFGNGFKYTYQVPRADFDRVLAETLAARGVEILFRHGVTAVDFQPAHATATIEKPDGEKISVRAKFILDCSGYGRVLPRLLDLEAPSNLPPRESLFAHVTGDVRPPEREQGKIWICMHPGGAWLWVIPFTNGRTSVGAVGAPEFFRQFSGPPEDQLRAILMGEPNAAKRLAKMEFAMPPQHINGYSCSVKKLFGERFALVGNATEFLDPVFSSGVALALASADRAAKVLSRQLRGEAVDWQRDYADFMMQGVDTFRAYVGAWYDGLLPQIFFATNKSQDIMRQVCAVLAGYVWDNTNPYVRQPERALGLLVKIVTGQAARA
jgi:flavin-dependent dehydrogenase